MGKLIIAEAMPQKLIRLFHLIRVILILACCMFLFFFIQKEKSIKEEYMEAKAYQKKMAEYSRILENAQECYEEGRLAESEQLYRQILSKNLIAPEPYLGLADIYCDSRLYDEALEVLKIYPEGVEDSRILQRIQEIEEYVQVLEQSLFVPIG